MELPLGFIYKPKEAKLTRHNMINNVKTANEE